MNLICFIFSLSLLPPLFFFDTDTVLYYYDTSFIFISAYAGEQAEREPGFGGKEAVYSINSSLITFMYYTILIHPTIHTFN